MMTRREGARLFEGCCVTIIGMAGAGKTTVGRELARQMDWAHVDTDSLIEATYGTVLQNVADSMSKEAFLDVEAGIICRIGAKRAVLSTGGSVVYRAEAMRHLASLGIARTPDRGLAIAPGQTIEDLYNERKALYETYQDFTLTADTLTPEECGRAILSWLETADA